MLPLKRPTEFSITPQVHLIFQNYCIFFYLKNDFVLVKSEDPGEMRHCAAIHMGLNSLPKYPFMSFQYTKGY